jgi:hypothetical protein
MAEKKRTKRMTKGPFGRDIDLDATTMDRIKDIMTFGSTRSAIKALTDKKSPKQNKRGGGMIKMGYKKGGSVKSKSIDGIAQRGKTRGTMR